LSRLARLSADPPTGSVREKPDRGLAPCQAFLAYSLKGGEKKRRTERREV